MQLAFQVDAVAGGGAFFALGDKFQLKQQAALPLQAQAIGVLVIAEAEFSVGRYETRSP